VRLKRIELADIKTQNDKRLGHLKDYKNYLEEIKNAVAENRENADAEAMKWIEHAKKLKFNYEVMVYLRQGQVEIAQ
jgi:F0F1-type ATP synthase membrane subunit b/b'